MTRTIQGNKYDTEQATELIRAVHLLHDPAHPCYFDCALYETPLSKRLFLAGTGGLLTRFAHCTPSRQRILLLSEAELQEFIAFYG